MLFILYFFFWKHTSPRTRWDRRPRPLRMAPHRPGSSSGGSHPASVSSGGGKANGLYQSGSAAAMAAAKKPNLQLIQADHELFLQAFESESLFATSCTIASELCWGRKKIIKIGQALNGTEWISNQNILEGRERIHLDTFYTNLSIAFRVLLCSYAASDCLVLHILHLI